MKLLLVGNPNCGKTTLFNTLTGSRQKVGNYPGVTVEHAQGVLRTPMGHELVITDLPGTVSLAPKTPDEAVTCAELKQAASDKSFVIAVVDVTLLEKGLSLVLELKSLSLPVLVVLNMQDLAERRGMRMDVAALSLELGLPVVSAVGTHHQGVLQLLEALDQWGVSTGKLHPLLKVGGLKTDSRDAKRQVVDRFKEVDRIIKKVVRQAPRATLGSQRIDRVVTHPLWGSLLLILVLGVLFQAVFAWAKAPQDWIKLGIERFGIWVGTTVPSEFWRGLIQEGVIAGTGSVLVFLPQILILFFFLQILEDSGYMARAAFLMDRLMGRVGLHGRAFIPLLSSYACAIPGIMATRTIENPRDRLATILVAPLTTCSARLPVYTLIIGAFVPDRTVWGLGLQGLVMMALYALGAVFALIVAYVLKRTVLVGPKPPLLLELPTYKRPSLRTVVRAMISRSQIFVKRAGTLILGLSVLLWVAASYPQITPQQKAAGQSSVEVSWAGQLGKWIEPAIKPLGMDWRMGVGLITGFAAREVVISALATTYAVENSTADGDHLAEKLKASWGLPTALSLLVWYVFAFQCLSTFAVMRRETGGMKWPLFGFFYMSVLAYGGSWVAYRAATWLGW